MYDLSSKYYDLIYSFKDYKNEAEHIGRYIRRHNPDCRTLLDVACGTGQHAYYLNEFEVDGIDLNSEFVNIASRKNPQGEFHVADMTDFRLGKKYDAVMCLFSSIGYVKSLENVAKTLRQFKAHLNEGGIMLVEPWFAPMYGARAGSKR